MDFAQRRRVAPAGAGAVRHPAVRPSLTPRHEGLFAAVHRLDTGLDDAARTELAGWISAEYARAVGEVPLGLVARCRLGEPYLEHRLDLEGVIVEHCAAGDPMPEPFASARMLVRTGGYAFVEVHSGGRLVPVRTDGSVVET